MRRMTAILAALILLLGCAWAEPAEELPDESAYKLEAKIFPFYLGSITFLLDGGFPLYFMDGADDLPFVTLEDWTDLLNYLHTDGGAEPGYEMTMTVDDPGHTVSLTRENEYRAVFDFDACTITFEDYIAVTGAKSENYMDLGSTDEFFIRDGQPFLLTMTGSRDRYGEITVLDLGKYMIPMIVSDGKYLLPLHTLDTFFLGPLKYGLYFNGEALILSAIQEMKDPKDTLIEQLDAFGLLDEDVTDRMMAYDGPDEGRDDYYLELFSGLSEEAAGMVEEYRQARESSLYVLYDSVPKAPRSEDLIDYSYHTLCLELDSLYGLKESHSISDFNLFFLQTGLMEDLISPDAAVADKAVSDLASYWFDDSHSGFISHSCLTDSAPDQSIGFSIRSSQAKMNAASEARDSYPEACMPYYETGDTAYITFDEFGGTPDDDGFVDYYALAESGEELPNDTFGIIMKAHQMITRENSPIRNVVLDLSCNGGGMAPMAIYTVCWFLGESEVSIHNTFNGAQSTMTYLADINLDHQFTEEDTLAGRGLNLYCLISPSSFSCGNLVPWAFKEDGRVTLLGKVSGGGSCVVMPMTTAWGTSYQMSGCDRLAFVKNGSYYDVDRGVEPDHIIDSYDHFYDRDALTEYIHSLY